MLEFKTPLKDMRFLLYDVFDFPAHYKLFPSEDVVDADLIDSILEGGAEFGEKVLFPLYMSGDKDSCRLEDGHVITPKGFKEAYEEFVAGGWTTLSHNPKYGGQGLPHSLSAVFSEIMGTANWPWAMYPGLTHGAINTIEMHGEERYKELFLPPLVEGSWAGTMCLTEAHCGSDLGQLRTRAVPQEDGSYKITGSKIFISSGDHDFTDNIIHVVLARLPDAPEGTKGISLFIVPKIMVAEDGTLGERNAVEVGSLETKMGIKGSATAVVNFDDAVGYLIGPPNRGLNCMFTFINTSRVGNAIQGVASAELSYQGARKYAKERLSMRSLTGKKAPDLPADPIIVHPEVRKMLLIQRSIAEGGRAMIYQAAKIVDFMSHGETEAVRKAADKRLGLLTPILKGFLTELGVEAAGHGVQIYGGHGYIKEMGMEQVLRDVRISTIYEGTTQIQALDLLGRKIMLDRARELDAYITEIKAFCGKYGPLSVGYVGLRMKRFTKPLNSLVRQWKWTTKRLMLKASRDRNVAGSASVDYLMYSGYIVLAYAWAQIAEVALTQLEKGGDETFLKGKIQTARFYYQRMLPRAIMHHKCMTAPPESVMAIREECF